MSYYCCAICFDMSMSGPEEFYNCSYDHSSVFSGTFLNNKLYICIVHNSTMSFDHRPYHNNYIFGTANLFRLLLALERQPPGAGCIKGV